MALKAKPLIKNQIFFFQFCHYTTLLSGVSRKQYIRLKPKLNTLFFLGYCTLQLFFKYSTNKLVWWICTAMLQTVLSAFLAYYYNHFCNFRCWVSGWGRNDFVSGSYQAIQKQVDVLVRTQDDCQRTLSQTRLGTAFIFDRSSFMCAGGDPGKDACTVRNKNQINNFF